MYTCVSHVTSSIEYIVHGGRSTVILSQMCTMDQGKMAWRHKQRAIFNSGLFCSYIQMKNLYIIVLRTVSRSSKTIKSEQNIDFCDLLMFCVHMTL